MHILLQAFILGAVGGVIPGAVLTILLVSTMQGGLKTGLRAFFWAMFSEITIAGVLLLVAVQLQLGAAVFTWIGFVGSVVLFYFAWQVLKLRSVNVESNSTLFTPVKIFLLSATNAPLYIFWTTICFPLIWQLASSWPITVAAPFYFLFFEIGWGLTTFIMLLLFVFSRKTLTDERVMRKVFIIISIILFGFGVEMLVQSLGNIL